MKDIKVRKDHACCMCNLNIKKGENARVDKFRTPRFDDYETQIGIEYHKYYYCKDYEACEERLSKIESEPLNF